MTIGRQWVAGLMLGAVMVGQAQAEGRSIIVLDGSGSMWGQIDGKAKLEIARKALATVVSGLPEDAEIGLMAYGHRTKGQCDDIELVVPPARGSGPDIVKAAEGMKFLGKTPLTAAVREAAGALRSTEAKATVILITDGIETCDADPCALATELEQSGVDFTAHVVGFGLSKDEGKAVSCLAENTGGRYVEAGDAASLEAALRQTVVAEPAPVPVPQPVEVAQIKQNFDPILKLTADSAEGDFGQNAIFDLIPLAAASTPGAKAEVRLYGDRAQAAPPGRFLMRTELGPNVIEQEVEITTTAVARPEVILNAGIADLRMVNAPGGEIARGVIRLKGVNTKAERNEYDGVLKGVMPADAYKVVLELGAITTEAEITITAGQKLSHEFVMAAGVVGSQTLYAEGVPHEGAARREVLSATQDIQGKRKSFGTEYRPEASFTLAPGDYVLRTTVGEAEVDTPFSVKPNERVDVVAILDAGVVAITQPKGQRLEILAAAKDIAGNQKIHTSTYNATENLALPAGDYVGRARNDAGEVKDYPFAVQAGARTELSITPF